MPRLVVLSYFEPKDVPMLLHEVERARIPAGVPVYVGSYGPNPGVAQQVASAGCRYAPMVAFVDEWYREKRRLPPDQDPLVPKRFAGPVPPVSQLGSTAARVSWGVELGSRYRDRIRAAQDAGIFVDTWQFDELVPATVRSPALREFVRGVLRGLVFGRPVLEDAAMQGFVWVANSALGLAGMPVTAELASFWRILNRAALGYVGEEYPRFEGNPRTTARAQASGQRA